MEFQTEAVRGRGHEIVMPPMLLYPGFRRIAFQSTHGIDHARTDHDRVLIPHDADATCPDAWRHPILEVYIDDCYPFIGVGLYEYAAPMNVFADMFDSDITISEYLGDSLGDIEVFLHFAKK